MEEQEKKDLRKLLSNGKIEKVIGNMFKMKLGIKYQQNILSIAAQFKIFNQKKIVEY